LPTARIDRTFVRPWRSRFGSEDEPAHTVSDHDHGPVRKERDDYTYRTMPQIQSTCFRNRCTSPLTQSAQAVTTQTCPSLSSLAPSLQPKARLEIEQRGRRLQKPGARHRSIDQRRALCQPVVAFSSDLQPGFRHPHYISDIPPFSPSLGYKQTHVCISSPWQQTALHANPSDNQPIFAPHQPDFNNTAHCVHQTYHHHHHFPAKVLLLRHHHG